MLNTFSNYMISEIGLKFLFNIMLFRSYVNFELGLLIDVCGDAVSYTLLLMINKVLAQFYYLICIKNFIIFIIPATRPEFLEPEYGEVELQYICSKFSMPSTSTVKVDYRDFKESQGSVLQNEMRFLYIAIGTLPVSTASCERGFS